MDVLVGLRAAADLVFPRGCAVCGAAVSPASPWPLCPSCVGHLVPMAEPRCCRCGKTLLSEHQLCTRCRQASFHFGRAIPVYRYAGTVKSAILVWKGGDRRSLSRLFARSLHTALSEHFPGAVLVPVPPRPGKVRTRGWDQVDDVARILERQYGWAVLRALARVGRARAQKTLGLAERASNLSGSIVVTRPLVSSVPYVLVDDIITTGATLDSCARALLSKGAVSVNAVTLAAH